jgi:lysozyme
MKLKGLDLSKWNTIPDYQKLSNSGLAFAYIKASEAEYRDATYADKHQHLSESGLLCGSYHFFKASVDPWLQARVFLEVIGNNVEEGEMPPVLDIEDPSETLTVSQYEDAISMWLTHIEQTTGVKPMIYTGGWYWEQLKTLNNTSRFKDYPLWLSSYTPEYGPMFGGWTAPTIWQYTEKGSVAEINPVDEDWFFGSPSDLWAFSRMKPIQAGRTNTTKTKAVQTRLAQLGYYQNTIDGNFGPNTANAIIAFQKEKGLNADGIVEEDCWSELFGWAGSSAA